LLLTIQRNKSQVAVSMAVVKRIHVYPSSACRIGTNANA